MGINAAATRAIIKSSDILLIYFGAVIPDFPWILQRVMQVIIPNFDRYDLRIYCIALSSLFFSFILCLSIAVIFKERKKVIFILLLGSFFHLLADSIETKWGNGVHLFAPFDWKLLNFRIFWPESFVIYAFTAASLIAVIYYWRKALHSSILFDLSFQKNIFLSLIIALSYFTLPLAFMNQIELSDNHFVKTLRNYDNRTGKYFEADRGYFINSDNQDIFRTPFNEELKVTNLDLDFSNSMSICAEFISPNEIRIIEYHLHSNRDIFTYVGLVLIIIQFLFSVKVKLKKINT